ncbi:MAG: hypothetical protein J6U62_04335 [Bacteroidaceae bacterium]|nr:hypothetical protein [Bacteroidaceae bacterium]
MLRITDYSSQADFIRQFRKELPFFIAADALWLLSGHALRRLQYHTAVSCVQAEDSSGERKPGRTLVYSDIGKGCLRILLPAHAMRAFVKEFIQALSKPGFPNLWVFRHFCIKKTLPERQKRKYPTMGRR